MEEQKEKRPLILEIDEAKLEIIQAINNAIHMRKLPCYIVDMILSELSAQIKEGAKNELEMVKAQVEEQKQNEEVA